MSPERAPDPAEIRPGEDARNVRNSIARTDGDGGAGAGVWPAPGAMTLWEEDAPRADGPGGRGTPHAPAGPDSPENPGEQPDALAPGVPDDLDDPDDEEELPPPSTASLSAVPPSAPPPPVAPSPAAGAGDERPLPPAQAQAQNEAQNPPQNPEDEQTAPPSPDGDEPMTLLGHLNEMRRRLARMVIMVILGFIACYGVAEPVYAWLSEPLQAALPEGSKLIYTSPQGAFFVYLKVALVASIFVTSPFSFYQIWAFIAPGLYREEKQAIAPLAFFSAFFFLAGASFCYFLVFPLAFRFFMGFTTDVIVPMISVEEYLSFALKLLIAFGLVFEMPLFAHFLAKLGVLSPDMMRRQRKYAILLIFIVAAILTPPDVFSQCLMAAPMLLLYEVSVWVAALAKKRRDARQAARNANAGEDHTHEKS